MARITPRAGSSRDRSGGHESDAGDTADGRRSARDPDPGLRIFTSDEKYSVEALGSKWGQQDQQFGFGLGRLGLWNLGFSWDETPHVRSTTARMLESEVGRGVFTLPTPRSPLTAYNFGRRLDEVGVRWDTGKLSFSLTPTPGLELRADYTRIHKHGDRPIGMPFGGPGSNVLETLEPIDQTIHDLRLKANIAHDRWQLQLGYAWSMFENGNRIVTADNPCFGLPAAVTAAQPGCGADAAGAQPTGGVSLAPSNQAHTWSIAGGVNLPMNTRINANVAYALRFQSASFLPQTVNPAVVSPLLGLPARSLDGTVATTLVSLQAVTRPLLPLTLTAKYRYYDYNDMTKELQFSGRVLDDRFVVAENVKALRRTPTSTPSGASTARSPSPSAPGGNAGTATKKSARSRRATSISARS